MAEKARKRNKKKKKNDKERQALLFDLLPDYFCIKKRKK